MLQLLSIGTPATANASIAFFFLYMFTFGATVNVVPWVWGPELLPLEARTRGVALSVSSHWTWNFCIVMITPVLISRIGWATYILFTVLLAAFVPIVSFSEGVAVGQNFTDALDRCISSIQKVSQDQSRASRDSTVTCRPPQVVSADEFVASNLSLEEIDNLFLPVDYQVQAAAISFQPESEKQRRASYSSVGKTVNVIEHA